MILATSFVLERTLTFNKSNAYRRNVLLLILGIFISFSIYHCVTDRVLVHNVLFASLCILVANRVRKLWRQRMKDEAMKAKLRRVFRIGRSMSLLGSKQDCCLLIEPSMCHRWIWTLEYRSASLRPPDSRQARGRSAMGLFARTTWCKVHFEIQLCVN